MQENQELYMMIGSLTFQLKVMKEQCTTAVSTSIQLEHEYIQGYIQGFKDRFEGLQPRYNDIKEKTKEWYDYSSMEMHRLDELKSKKQELDNKDIQDEIIELQMGYLDLQDVNQRLIDENKENQETIKRLQVERAEFNLALRKAEDDMRTLRARSHDIQKDSQRTNDEMIVLKKKFHKFSCQLQDEIHILKEENKRLEANISQFQSSVVKAENLQTDIYYNSKV
jgi:chromosome segregation ATPase